MGDVEFPYWQPAVAPILLSHLSLLGDFIFIVYFPLLVVVVIQQEVKLLDLIHVSLFLLISVTFRYSYGMCLFVLYCTIFKNYFSARDDQLNQRMLSLPSMVEISGLNLLGQLVLLQMLQLGDYSLYWVLTIWTQLLAFLGCN